MIMSCHKREIDRLRATKLGRIQFLKCVPFEPLLQYRYAEAFSRFKGVPIFAEIGFEQIALGFCFPLQRAQLNVLAVGRSRLPFELIEVAAETLQARAGDPCVVVERASANGPFSRRGSADPAGSRFDPAAGRRAASPLAGEHPGRPRSKSGEG